MLSKSVVRKEDLLETDPSEPPTEGQLSLAELLPLARKYWWKIVGASLAIGVVSMLMLLRLPNYYRARTIISPSGDEAKTAGPLGALASFGIQLGGSSKIEDLETLIRSQDLTARIFARNDIWSVTLGSNVDEATKSLRPGFPFRLWDKPRPLSDWDAIRYADDTLKTVLNKKAGTLSITVDALTPEASARILGYYLDEAKNRLQAEALDRAVSNKGFLEQQIAVTPDALARDRLFSLLGQEIEKEMMARNREQFGFRIIDAPRIPDRKAGPKRSPVAVLVTLMSMIGFSALVILRHRRGIAS